MGRFTMVCVLCALVGVHSAVAFSRVVVRIFEGSNNFGELERRIVSGVGYRFR